MEEIGKRNRVERFGNRRKCNRLKKWGKKGKILMMTRKFGEIVWKSNGCKE